jgi:hypothetical protein
VVECTALEMRHACKGIGGSNPPLSAIMQRLFFLEFFARWCRSPSSGKSEQLSLEIRQKTTCSGAFRFEAERQLRAHIRTLLGMPRRSPLDPKGPSAARSSTRRHDPEPTFIDPFHCDWGRSRNGCQLETFPPLPRMPACDRP